MATAFLKKYIKDTYPTDDVTKMKVVYEFSPFPLTAQFKAIAKAAAGSISGFLITISFLMISDSQV